MVERVNPGNHEVQSDPRVPLIAPTLACVAKETGVRVRFVGVEVRFVGVDVPEATSAFGDRCILAVTVRIASATSIVASPPIR